MSWCGTKKAQKLLAMNPSTIVVFDLETTGIHAASDEILQISLVDGSGITLFSSYVKPTHHKKWPSAQKVNHISPEKVADAPTFDEIRGEIQDCFNNAKLVAGYNMTSFDIKVIERYGIVIPLNRFDVMNEFRLYTGRVAGYRLSDCAKYFGHGFAAHDASADARTTALCMQDLIWSDGFVNMTPTKLRKSTSVPETYLEPEKSKKRPVKGRIFGKILKRRSIHPIVLGPLLIVLSLVLLNYTAGSNIFPNGLQSIDIALLSKTISANTKNLLIALLMPIGIIAFLVGIFRIFRQIILSIINLFRKIIKKVL